jgi:hypothetical protein
MMFLWLSSNADALTTNTIIFLYVLSSVKLSSLYVLYNSLRKSLVRSLGSVKLKLRLNMILMTDILHDKLILSVKSRIVDSNRFEQSSSSLVFLNEVTFSKKLRKYFRIVSFDCNVKLIVSTT